MRKYTLYAVAILTVFVVVWWLLLGNMSVVPSQAPPIPQKPTGAVTAAPVEKSVAQAHPNPPLEAGRETRSEQRLKWREMMLQLDQTPMDLFGVVLDQKDQPVSDATVRISWNPLEGDTIEVFLKSGDDGKFEFTGRKGRYVSVDIKKEGYDVIFSERSRKAAANSNVYAKFSARSYF